MAALDEHDVDPDPFRQFDRWFDEATAAGVRQPEAMTVATATPDGRVSARMVLLRGFDDDGVTFFTSYDSRKARELEANPHAALVFHWREQERQVRVEGTVRRTTAQGSDAYFRSRPFGSRVSASVSPQSEVVADREELERAYDAAVARFPDGDVPRPSNWGGYVVEPVVFEFWQGRPDRLHDRVRYRRATASPEGTAAPAGWVIERLAP